MQRLNLTANNRVKINIRDIIPCAYKLEYNETHKSNANNFETFNARKYKFDKFAVKYS